MEPTPQSSHLEECSCSCAFSGLSNGAVVGCGNPKSGLGGLEKADHPRQAPMAQAFSLRQT